mgnify:CR=1 FL=1
MQKCESIAVTLRERGYNTVVEALIVGSLGSWDTANEPVLHRCRVSSKYCNLMRRLMCSETIRWSRDSVLFRTCNMLNI